MGWGVGEVPSREGRAAARERLEMLGRIRLQETTRHTSRSAACLRMRADACRASEATSGSQLADCLSAA
eukprot:12882405-Alexandrium_andersonii.AAC.1